MDNHRYWKKIFRWFKEAYPELYVRGTCFEPYAYMEIRVYIPRKGKVIYNPVGNTLKWEERWEDPIQKKREEHEKRPDLYQRFLSEIDIYQKETGASQGQIAELSGISRRSINKYLSGVVMPKTSTMIHIADSLGLDI